MDATLQYLIPAIEPLDAKAMAAARARQGMLTKPPDSLGHLEVLSIQVAGILGMSRPILGKKLVIVAAGDHGVVAQGVTAYPQEITAQMVLNFLAGGAAVSVMARHGAVDLLVVDAGVASDLQAHPKLRSLKIGRGTGDIAKGPAMSRQQAERCVIEGVNLAREAIAMGAGIIGTGDMGIGNTTPSSAIASVVTGHGPETTTGRGTGRTPEELARKTQVVREALAVNKPDGKDGFDILSKVGGFEIGVLAGVILGTASMRRPVVLDGFISGAAALIATVLCPMSKHYMIAAHRSAEAGHQVVLSHLGLRPLLDLDLRLGEGTGSVLAMSVVEAAAACLSEMATFGGAQVSNRPDSEPKT